MNNFLTFAPLCLCAPVRVFMQEEMAEDRTKPLFFMLQFTDFGFHIPAERFIAFRI